jgi:hypothetical protein
LPAWRSLDGRVEQNFLPGIDVNGGCDKGDLQVFELFIAYGLFDQIEQTLQID